MARLTMIVDFGVRADLLRTSFLTQVRETQAASQLPSSVTQYGVTEKKSTKRAADDRGAVFLRTRYVRRRNSWPTMNTSTLNDPVTRVAGIAPACRCSGAGRYAMRMWLKPDALTKLGVTVSDVVNAVQSQNTVNPTGQMGGEPAPKGQEFTYSVRAQGRLTTPEQFGDIIVRENPNGGAVRVKDVARIELGAQTYTLAGRLNGKPAAALAIYQLPGSNAVNDSKAVQALMAQLKKSFPPDIDYAIALDQTKAVTEGIREIVLTLGIALVLVIIVVYLFLQGWRATLIPLLAVPVSLVGTFAFFPLFGFSVNTLSMFGMVLAIGLVVDDAIVVVEAVERHIEEGMAPERMPR